MGLLRRKITRILMVLLAFISFLEQLGAMSRVLNQMSTTEKQFPLQRFLAGFNPLWNVTNSFWELLLGEQVKYTLFDDYAFGGITYAVIFFCFYQMLTHEIVIPDSKRTVRGQIVLGLMAVFFMGTIIYGLDRDLWVPYVQEPSWVINMVHKQQISAGTYFFVFYFMLIHSFLPTSKAYAGSTRFISSYKIMFYTFFFMSLENFASFDWFPGFIDPDNMWLSGYEEIFREGQDWTSSDKIFHFSMSSVVVLLVLMFATDAKKAVVVALSLVIAWELFEIGLNPKEASDSLLDMVINSSAIILTAILYSRYVDSDDTTVVSIL